MLNDWSHKVRAISKKYCPGNIQKILPSSQSAWNTRFYVGHQKLCMDNNMLYFIPYPIIEHILIGLHVRTFGANSCTMRACPFVDSSIFLERPRPTSAIVFGP